MLQKTNGNSREDRKGDMQGIQCRMAGYQSEGQTGRPDLMQALGLYETPQLLGSLLKSPGCYSYFLYVWSNQDFIPSLCHQIYSSLG